MLIKSAPKEVATAGHIRSGLYIIKNCLKPSGEMREQRASKQ